MSDNNIPDSLLPAIALAHAGYALQTQRTGTGRLRPRCSKIGYQNPHRP